MFPIDMKHIGKIESVGTAQVFGYSARKVDRDLQDLAYLNYAGPPALSAARWAGPPSVSTAGVNDRTGYLWSRSCASLTEYRLGRIAEWSQPRCQLGDRFVALTLLIDQGENAEGERFKEPTERPPFVTLASQVAA